jgi:hypothetical protein
MHIDHNGYPTLNFNVTKGVGRCVFCLATFTTLQLMKQVNAVHLMAHKPSVASLRRESARGPKVEAPSTDLWTPLTGAKGVMAARAADYLFKRGATPEMIQKYGVGFGTVGRLWGRLVFPLFEDNKLVYYQARIVGNAGGPKYLNPSESDACLGKSSVVGYIQYLRPNEPFIITEGLMSAWGASELFGCPAVAVLGKTISDVQAIKLSKLHLGRCTLMFDPDVSNDQLRKASKKLSQWGIAVDIVHLTEKQGDPWDLYRTKVFKH